MIEAPFVVGGREQEGAGLTVLQQPGEAAGFVEQLQRGERGRTGMIPAGVEVHRQAGLPGQFVDEIVGVVHVQPVGTGRDG